MGGTIYNLPDDDCRTTVETLAYLLLSILSGDMKNNYTVVLFF